MARTFALSICLLAELLGNGININNIKNTKIVPYIYNMSEMMNVSSIIVARSGAMTITEIALVGKPAIFIPLPNVSNNHQEYNAKVLANVDAAKIISNNELNAKILNNNIESIICDEKIMLEMGQNAKKIAVNNVEDKIYEEIKKIVK